MYYYTSDLHFGHANIIKYENRPFTDVEDMTKQLIEKWNNKVNKLDSVFILGDLAFIGSRLSIEEITKIIKQLNGTKYLIAGNHDKWVSKTKFDKSVFKQIIPYAEISDPNVSLENNNIILSHYPIEYWNGKEHGSIHLHGHTHSAKIPIIPNRYNVGVDVRNYEPVTLKEILNGRD